MATKKDPDEVKITLMCDIVVSEQRWRELMKSHGIDMSGIYTGAHVQKAAKRIVKNKFEEMGFPQPQIPEFKP